MRSRFAWSSRVFVHAVSCGLTWFVAFAATNAIAPGGGTACAQTLLQSWSDPNSRDYGERIATLGDVDGDGRADVAIVSLIYGSTSFSYVVEIRSSHDGSLLATIDRGYQGLLSIGSAGDVDGDGSDDVLVGNRSVTEVVSSKTGALLAQVQGKDQTYFGYQVAGVGDVDGDGTPDFAASGLNFGIGGYFGGYVDVCSGKDGHVFYEFTDVDDGGGGAFGQSLAALPDLDGDGVQDLLVGVPLGHAYPVGFVRAFSLKTGSIIATVDAPAGYYGFGGVGVAVCQDFTGDGVADWVVLGGSIASSFPGSDQAWLISGADRSIVQRLPVPRKKKSWTSVSGAGDVNGDGVGDFMFGSSIDIEANSLRSMWLYDGQTRLPLYTFEQESDVVGPFVAGVPDVDGDGFDDVLLGPTASSTVELRSGNDLFLNASPVVCLAGDTLRKTMRTGIPGNLGMIALVGVDGVPFFLPTLGPAAFDSTGSMGYAVTVPTGLAGHTLDYLGFAINGKHHVIVSAVEHVTFN